MLYSSSFYVLHVATPIVASQTWPEELMSAFTKLNTDINSPSAAYILKLANRLCREHTAEFLLEFLEATQKFYQAELKPVDFIGAPGASREEINSWLKQQTDSEKRDAVNPFSNILNLS
ncbi:leukocyte elastase inhibitor-like isoform X2 [Betta splendens]|uniref:Leukocyte elastase inhibitor-like isoform X2 n=1 Tax=Betta splendens TaxID=158456 RepID=A0A9W2XKI3_BETSP|nr:leukocyte elastase inhibitor-like isoform X2 [Betta splendens]